MCGGIEVAGRYTESDKPVKVYFPNPKAALSVLQANGSVEWVAWGRRQEQDGHLPATGWARVDSISADKWASFHPRDVRIVAEHFMEKDPAGVSHWLRNCTPLNHQFALALTTDCVRLDQRTPPVAIGKERPGAAAGYSATSAHCKWAGLCNRLFS